MCSESSRRRSASPPRSQRKRRRSAEQLSNLIDGDLIEVIVSTGPSQKKWHLPRNLLIDSSPFFRSALTSPFKESSEQKITMPEDSPDAFLYLVQYLYSCTIDHVPRSSKPLPTPELLTQQRTFTRTMLLLYVLSAKLLITPLKNLAMDRYREACRLGDPEPSPADVKEALAIVPEESKFRKLLVQFVAGTVHDLFQDIDASIQYDDEYFADTFFPCFDGNYHFQLEVFFACSNGLVENPFFGSDRLWHSV